MIPVSFMTRLSSSRRGAIIAMYAIMSLPSSNAQNARIAFAS
jgi:hypothetical protein